MNTGSIDGNNNLNKSERANTGIESFFTEILAAEQRILIKQQDNDETKSAVNLYKESILIRELFSHITKYFNFATSLTIEQDIVAKRIWNKAFNTALAAAKNIKKKTILSRIEIGMAHALNDLKAPY